MILDEVMPNSEHSVVAHAVVEADAATTWRAVHEANLFTDRTVRWLIALRDLPSFAWDRIRGRPAELVPPSITFDDILQLEGWTLLGEEPRRELVAGSIGRFWERGYGWTDVAAEEFAGFSEPGFAKTVAGISIRSYGDQRTLVSYESRTSTTSADAARQFGRYWFVLRPFVGLVMRRAVAAIRVEAERSSRTLAAAR